MIIKDYYFYVCDHNFKDDYDFYGSRDSLTEANKLVDFLENKGYNSFWVKDEMVYEAKTKDYTKPIKKYYFEKPLMLIKEKTEKSFEELLADGKSLKEINKIMKERESKGEM